VHVSSEGGPWMGDDRIPLSFWPRFNEMRVSVRLSRLDEGVDWYSRSFPGGREMIPSSVIDPSSIGISQGCCIISAPNPISHPLSSWVAYKPS